MLDFLIGILLSLFGIYWLKSNLPDTISRYLQNPKHSERSIFFMPILIAVLDLPIQLMMISLSGNNFGHYFMSAFPSITVLSAFFFWTLFSNPDRYQAVILTAALTLPVLISGISSIFQNTRMDENSTTKIIAAYVQEVTQPGDPVFFWSNTVSTYIVSERLSPSIYFFTDPLFLKGYTNRIHTEPFLEQLQANPPKIIVVEIDTHHPFIYLDDPAQCSQLRDMDFASQVADTQFHSNRLFIPEGMPDVYAWICANYTQSDVTLPGMDKWDGLIYQYTPDR